MRASERQHLSRIVTMGDKVFTVYPPDPSACFVNVLYRVMESHGYQTGFQPAPRFYIVTLVGGVPRSFHGVTKDARRRTFESFCAETGRRVEIHNQTLLDAWKAA